MGDRANIIVKQKNGGNPVYLYTHWGGTELPETLQEGLKRGRPRWNDGAYLTRILFCQMIGGDVKGETGYGISTQQCDNEHDYLVVDPKAQRVTVIKYEYTERVKDPLRGEPLAEYSFEDYCALDLSDGAPWISPSDD